MIHRLAIVGAGPRGFYSLERLTAELAARPLGQPVVVHLFDRSPTFGASSIYDPRQADYILTNSSVADMDAWSDVDPPSVSGRGPSFRQWYAATYPSRRRLRGGEYVPRAEVGRYLMESFGRARGHLPPGVELHCHRAEVVDVVASGAYRLTYEGGDGVRRGVEVDKVLFATGHSQVEPRAEERSYRAFAGRHPEAVFVPFVYPVDRTMASIPRGARVAMKGIGLTFIDAVLELTEGRGGRFERHPDGTLGYRPSGREPCTILPFSRSGLPMTPKADDLPPHLRRLTFFTDGALAALRRRAGGRPLDLDRDLWPLFELEMERAFYRVAMGDGEARRRLEACGDDGEAMRRAIEEFLAAHPEVRRFDYRAAIDPVGDRAIDGPEDFCALVERHMAEEIERAHRGQSASPVKAAIDYWYEARYVLGSVLESCGLTAASHRKAIEEVFPRLKRVVFGPPAINIEKLLALLRAGLLDFSVARGPEIGLDEERGLFELRCRAIPGAEGRAEVMVDARYPPVDLRRAATPLFRSLQARGLARPLVNAGRRPGEADYEPGAIDMEAGTCSLIDSRGVANEDLTVIGIPTEGNLVGNFTLSRGPYPRAWAARVVEQLRARERSSDLRQAG